jgi:hypothetical protein
LKGRRKDGPQLSLADREGLKQRVKDAQARGEYISGQQLADELGVNRSHITRVLDEDDLHLERRAPLVTAAEAERYITMHHRDGLSAGRIVAELKQRGEHPHFESTVRSVLKRAAA